MTHKTKKMNIKLLKGKNKVGSRIKGVRTQKEKPKVNLELPELNVFDLLAMQLAQSIENRRAAYVASLAPESSHVWFYTF
jgi:hypothetical protein